MLVRHNTALLEQAIDLQVKRSAIPTLQAEAAAHEKIARANGFRRMATGGAIAVAALGIGLGIKFGLLDSTYRVPEAPRQEAQREAPPPVQPETKDEVPIPAPRPTEATPQNEALEKALEELGGKPAEAPKQPDIVTVDFTKFATRTVSFAGSSWTLESGHHYGDEKDPIWDSAWCYTRRKSNDGVEIQVMLVNRDSPNAKPLAPISSRETLGLAGIDDSSALELASQCPWLDNASFRPSDFETSPERKKQTEEAQTLVVQDGWDALGSDLPGKEFRGISFSACQDLCKGDDQCVAVTYNKKHSMCFLKGDASILVRNDDATTAARGSVRAKLQYSTLVFATNTVVVGNSYASVQSGYADCVKACASDQRCQGFNHDGANKMCYVLDQVTSSQAFKGIASGLKANRT